MIWVEKYRPKEFSDVIGLDFDIQNLDNHILFIGPPGTGKTTTARIIIKKKGVECLELNASDERGIDTIRDKVKSFAMTKGVSGKGKIIFLDEADALTKDAQTSLRNLMETYSSNCKFIMTCNYANKILDPLKSRCTVIELSTPSKEKILSRLKEICSKEGVHLTDDTLNEIIEQYSPDIRKCINILQELSINPNAKIKSYDIIENLIKCIQARDFDKARKIYLDSQIDPETLLIDMYQYTSKNMPISNLMRVIPHIANTMRDMNFVANKDILFESFLLKLMEEQ